jgi:hypothetical protein
MQDYEKLGVFYLGREREQRRTLLYDTRHLTTHAFCVGMTGSGKTGLVRRPARGGGHRRHTGNRDRPEGRHGKPAAHLPGSHRLRVRAVGERRRGAAPGLDVKAFAAQTAERWRKGLAEWHQDGARIAAAARRSRFRRLHTGVGCRHTGFDPLVLRGAGRGHARRPRGVPRSCSGHRGLAARPCRHQGGRHVARARVAVGDLRSTRGDRAATSISRSVIGLGPATTRCEDWRAGGGQFLPGQRSLRPCHGAQQPVGFAGFRAWLEGEPLDLDRLLYTRAKGSRASPCSRSRI